MGKSGHMRFIDMSDYNSKARLCWWITMLLGTAAVGYAIPGVLRLDVTSVGGMGVVMGMVVLAGLRAITIAGSTSSISSGDVFVFMALLFWGVPAATLVAAADAAAAAYRSSHRWTSRLGSPAIMAITIFTSGTLLEWTLQGMRVNGFYDTTTFLIALLLFSVLYSLLNSAMVTVHMALRKRLPMIDLWRTTYGWAILPYAASASAAGLIFLATRSAGPSVLLAAGPLIAIIFATSHLRFKRTQERASAAVAQATQVGIHLREMRESDERFRSAFHQAPIGMALMEPSGRLLQVNRALCELVGLSESELLGSTLHNVTHPDDLEVLCQTIVQMLSGETVASQAEQRYLHQDGHEISVLVSTSLVSDPQSHSPLLIFQIQDIEDRKRATQLAFSANHDSLTGLPNRALFLDVLKRALSCRRRRSDEMFAVLFLDCDRFKQINDNLGHHAGDQLLVSMARRLERATRRGDTVARFGGDEFTILLGDVANRTEAMALVDRIQRDMAPPFEIDNKQIRITTSIGIALSIDGYVTPEEMLRDADAAMYHAKSLGNAQSVISAQGDRLRGTAPL